MPGSISPGRRHHRHHRKVVNVKVGHLLTLLETGVPEALYNLGSGS